MHGSDFDEAEFFASIEHGGARALLIGRRALVALGLPVMTGAPTHNRGTGCSWSRG